jgi:hypothetical protein
MSRTSAKFTQADLNRATKAAAVVEGFRVRMTSSGELVIERAEAPVPSEMVDSKREIRL